MEGRRGRDEDDVHGGLRRGFCLSLLVDETQGGIDLHRGAID